MSQKIIVVKKVKTDGSLCRKSAKVLRELEQAKLLNKIDQIVFAQENRPESSGMALAYEHQVPAAPFFLVEQEDGSTQIYTDYLHFFQEVLHYSLADTGASEKIIHADRDLDFFI